VVVFLLVACSVSGSKYKFSMFLLHRALGYFYYWLPRPQFCTYLYSRCCTCNGKPLSPAYKATGSNTCLNCCIIIVTFFLFFCLFILGLLLNTLHCINCLLRCRIILFSLKSLLHLLHSVIRVRLSLTHSLNHSLFLNYSLTHSLTH
jgi:hypothetical protein